MEVFAKNGHSVSFLVDHFFLKSHIHAMTLKKSFARSSFPPVILFRSLPRTLDCATFPIRRHYSESRKPDWSFLVLEGSMRGTARVVIDYEATAIFPMQKKETNVKKWFGAAGTRLHDADCRALLYISGHNGTHPMNQLAGTRERFPFSINMYFLHQVCCAPLDFMCWFARLLSA